MSQITDAQLDALIEQARPNLRASIRAAIEQLSPIHFFEIAKVPLESGQQWQLSIAVMLEPMAGLISGMILQGVPPMMQAYEKLKAPAPQKNGLSIPGM
jgi:hypothetical protein